MSAVSDQSEHASSDARQRVYARGLNPRPVAHGTCQGSAPAHETEQDEVMNDRDDFLAWLTTQLYDAEVPSITAIQAPGGLSGPATTPSAFWARS